MSNRSPAWELFDFLKELDFQILIERRQQMVLERDRLEEEIKDLNVQIEVGLKGSGVQSVLCSALGRIWQVYYDDNAGRLSLSTAKLLEQGVSAACIANCKVRGQPYTTVTVREVKE